MHSYRRAARFTGTGLAAAALTMTAWLPGAAAASTGWQIAFRAHAGASTIYNGLIGVSASGKASAWAVGGTDLSGATPGAPVAEQWNGTQWQAATLPSGLTGTLGAVSTPAQNDAWAVSQLGGYVLRWNGAMWSVAKTFQESPPASRQLTGVTAFSPANVWVFGAPGANPGLGTWHLRGTTWQQITSTALGGLQFSSILALSDSNVWVTATVAGGQSWRLLHFDGQGWTSVPVPSGVQLRSMAPDGHGGLWFTAARSSSQAPLAEHRSATGTWSTQALPTGPGQAFGIALIPGTTSLWASGYLDGSGGTGSDAVIWGHGPAA